MYFFGPDRVRFSSISSRLFDLGIFKLIASSLSATFCAVESPAFALFFAKTPKRFSIFRMILLSFVSRTERTLSLNWMANRISFVDPGFL